MAGHSADKLGLWRLATTKAYVYHMGNVAESWMYEELERCHSRVEEHNNGFGEVLPARQNWVSRLPWRARKILAESDRSCGNQQENSSGSIKTGAPHHLNSAKSMLRTLVSKIVNKRLRFETIPGGKAKVGRDVEGLHHVLFAGKNAVGRGQCLRRRGGDRLCDNHRSKQLYSSSFKDGIYCQLAPAVGIFGKDIAFFSRPVTLTATYLRDG